MKALRESLLDIGSLEKTIDNTVASEWLIEHSVQPIKVKKTKIGVEVKGDIVLRNVDNIPPIGINKVLGNVYIEDSTCSNPDGLFARYATVSGLFLTNCSNITELKWLPRYIDNELSIMGCKSLRSLEGTECSAPEVTIMKCGKRFSEKAVQDVFKGVTRIYCSLEEVDESFVNEAFSDPVLTRLYDQLRNNKLKIRIETMLDTSVRLDKITPSMRQTFGFDENSQAIKAARAIVANKNSDAGFIVTEDWDGNFVDLYNQEQKVYHLSGSQTYSRIYKLPNVTSILDRLHSDNLAMENIRFIHVWNLSKNHTERRWNIQQARMASREGVIDPTNKDQLTRFLQNQQARYKRAVKSLRAERQGSEYKQITAKVEALMTRFTKFINKMIADPSWATSIIYKTEDVFNSFRQGYIQTKHTQRYGVIYAFQKWSTHIVKTIAQSEYVWGNNDENLNQLNAAMRWADTALKDVGM